jgi:hypothetical protein
VTFYERGQGAAMTHRPYPGQFEARPAVFDYQTVKLMHLHGDERVPMTERVHSDPADHDPERRWTHGARIFRRTRCDEEIVVTAPGPDTMDIEPV